MPEVIPPDIRDELGYARSLDIDKLASEIEKIGFKCNNCGACCTRQDDVDESECGGGWADNAVVVYPFEIRRIMEVTGLPWLEVAVPPVFGEVDDKGRMHTFEWHLRQKSIGEHGVATGQDVQTCCFLNHKRCTIYEFRPFLCRTYPFYMSNRKLCVGPCEGLGVPISKNACLKLASVIKERYVEDMNQMILLLGMFEPYVPSDDGGSCDTCITCAIHGSESVKSSGRTVEYVVHDSEGAHQISIQQE